MTDGVAWDGEPRFSRPFAPALSWVRRLGVLHVRDRYLPNPAKAPPAAMSRTHATAVMAGPRVGHLAPHFAAGRDHRVEPGDDEERGHQPASNRSRSPCP